MSGPEQDQRSSLDARDDLLYIVDRWPALAAKLHPGASASLSGRVTSTSTKPLPIDVHVSDLMFEIEEKVARFYGHILMDETDWQPTTSAMPGLLEEVARRFGHFTEDPMLALGFADDAHEFRERVRKTLERPAPATYVGPCPPAEDGSWCGGELYIGEGKLSGRCRACGTAFTLAEQREWLDVQMDARLMTVTEIGRALKILGTPVLVDTIHKWAQRGRLVESVKGSGIYRLADAKALAERGVRRAA